MAQLYVLFISIKQRCIHRTLKELGLSQITQWHLDRAGLVSYSYKYATWKHKIDSLTTVLKWKILWFSFFSARMDTFFNSATPNYACDHKAVSPGCFERCFRQFSFYSCVCLSSLQEHFLQAVIASTWAPPTSCSNHFFKTSRKSEESWLEGSQAKINDGGLHKGSV